ncbi:hypothetical protein PD502_13785 [Staphylococcus aureus]
MGQLMGILGWIENLRPIKKHQTVISCLMQEGGFVIFKDEELLSMIAHVMMCYMSQ